MKPLSDLAYDSIRAGAPGLSDATCKVIAASIARKVRPVPAPSAAPAEPAGGGGRNGWFIREEDGRWMWTDRKITAVAALTEGYEVVPVGSKAAPADPVAGVGEAWERGPNFGFPTAEPGLREIVEHYYRSHGVAGPKDFARRYFAALAPSPYAGLVAKLVGALERAQEELRLIRMKDTDAVYDTTLRLDIQLALASARQSGGV